MYFHCLLFLRRNVSLCVISHARNHYEILNVPRNASRKDIKSAFVKLSKQHHPDVNKDHNSGVFIEISQAYNTLVDPGRRSSYDHELHVIETYTNRAKYSHYAGSSGAGYRSQAYQSNNSYPTRDWDQYNDYHYSNVHVHTNLNTRHNHFRVVRYLFALMVLASCFHFFAINKTHQEFQKASLEESRKNGLIYDDVRQTAKSRTVEQQLATLTTRHSEALNKLKENKKSVT